MKLKKKQTRINTAIDNGATFGFTFNGTTYTVDRSTRDVAGLNAGSAPYGLQFDINEPLVDAINAGDSVTLELVTTVVGVLAAPEGVVINQDFTFETIPGNWTTDFESLTIPYVSFALINPANFDDDSSVDYTVPNNLWATPYIASAQGQTGPAGAPGSPGVGYSNADVTAGELTFTGVGQPDAGPFTVRGPKGDNGESIRLPKHRKREHSLLQKLITETI